MAGAGIPGTPISILTNFTPVFSSILFTSCTISRIDEDPREVMSNDFASVFIISGNIGMVVMSVKKI
jgi:hypothetical protein